MLKPKLMRDLKVNGQTMATHKRIQCLERIMNMRSNGFWSTAKNMEAIADEANNCLEEVVDWFGCDDYTFEYHRNALALYYPRYMAYHREEQANA